jgi:hypothetical protein
LKKFPGPGGFDKRPRSITTCWFWMEKIMGFPWNPTN